MFIGINEYVFEYEYACEFYFKIKYIKTKIKWFTK